MQSVVRMTDFAQMEPVYRVDIKWNRGAVFYWLMLLGKTFARAETIAFVSVCVFVCVCVCV